MWFQKSRVTSDHVLFRFSNTKLGLVLSRWSRQQPWIYCRATSLISTPWPQLSAKIFSETHRNTTLPDDYSSEQAICTFYLLGPRSSTCSERCPYPSYCRAPRCPPQGRLVCTISYQLQQFPPSSNKYIPVFIMKDALSYVPLLLWKFNYIALMW